METRNARRTRHRAESGAAARGPSSREQNNALVPAEVSPLSARGSAMQIADYSMAPFSSFSCLLRPTRILGGHDVWRIDGLLPQILYSAMGAGI